MLCTNSLPFIEKRKYINRIFSITIPISKKCVIPKGSTLIEFAQLQYQFPRNAFIPPSLFLFNFKNNKFGHAKRRMRPPAAQWSRSCARCRIHCLRCLASLSSGQNHFILHLVSPIVSSNVIKTNFWSWVAILSYKSCWQAPRVNLNDFLFQFEKM